MTIHKKIEAAVLELINEYRKQKFKKLKNKSNIFFGRNISLGSKFQFILAEKLFINSSYKALVDYPLRYFGKYKSGKSGMKNLYPDILILDKKNNLKALVELKIDLGFLSNDFKNGLGRMIDAYKKNRKMSYNKFVGFSDSKDMQIKVPKRFIKIFIIVTKINHSNRVKPFIKTVKQFGFRPLILLDEIHPNPLASVENFKGDMDKLKKDAIKEIYNKKFEISRTFKGLFK